MFSKRKSIINLLFVAVVFILTMYYLFKGQDIPKLMSYMSRANGHYILSAIACVIIFIGSEALIIFYLLHNIKHKSNMIDCFHYSFVGFFFSSITPSASGGQPAQLYCMRKDKIPVSLATVILLVVTIAYKAVLVLLGITIVVIKPLMIYKYLKPIIGFCYLGIFLNAITVAFMLILVLHPTFAKQIMVKIIEGLHKFHLIKREDQWLNRLEHTMEQYSRVAQYLKNNTLIVFNVFLATLIQRLVLFSVTYMTYRAFGLHKTDAMTIILLQAMISVSVDMLPLPGGMGISEKLFLMIFTPVFGKFAMPGLIISRGISYYAQLIISALCALFIYLTIRNVRERKLIQ